MSSVTGEGIGSLRQLLARGQGGAIDDTERMVVKRRHLESLEQADQALERLEEANRNAFSLDILAIELESAVRALGEILGQDVDIDLLDRIFSEFCIGK